MGGAEESEERPEASRVPPAAAPVAEGDDEGVLPLFHEDGGAPAARAGVSIPDEGMLAGELSEFPGLPATGSALTDRDVAASALRAIARGECTAPRAKKSKR